MQIRCAKSRTACLRPGGLFLESAAHLLGSGGFLEDLLLFGRQPLESGFVHFLQDTIQLNVEVSLDGHYLSLPTALDSSPEIVAPGLREDVNGPCRHSAQVSRFTARVADLIGP